MNDDNSYIKYKSHFRLVLHPKDAIRFEANMNSEGIDYFTHPESQLAIVTNRYYLLEKDREKIDQIIISQEIPTNFDDHPDIDFASIKKMRFIYLKFAIVILTLTVIAFWILNGFSK